MWGSDQYSERGRGPGYQLHPGWKGDGTDHGDGPQERVGLYLGLLGGGAAQGGENLPQYPQWCYLCAGAADSVRGSQWDSPGHGGHSGPLCGRDAVCVV